MTWSLEPGEHVLIGFPEAPAAADLAALVRDTVYPDARIVFDTSKPDGAPRKLLDVTRLHRLGWRHHIALNNGIASTYRWFEGQASQPSRPRD